jgi:hypothetical protein
MTYDDRVRFYMETEPAWTIAECKRAARDDIEEELRYASDID